MHSVGSLWQCEDEEILLFPAWPRDWDVRFRLHAPLNITVKGALKNGKLLLNVTPEERKMDVVNMIEKEAQHD